MNINERREARRLAAVKRYKDNPEPQRAASRKRSEENREAISLKNKKRYEEDPSYRQAHIDRAAAYYYANSKKLQLRNIERRKTLRGKYLAYKTSARKRSILFDLTLDQFETFWQKPCFITTCPNTIDTIGLDRIDNSKGYTLDNVRSCCADHNRMKTDHTDDMFYRLAKSYVDWFNSTT